MNAVARRSLLLATLLTASAVVRAKEAATQAAFDPAESINTFTFDLYQQVANQRGNLILSPYSISTTLAMTYGGACGKTAQEMETTLHLGGQHATHPAFAHIQNKINGTEKKDNIELNVANSLWPQSGYPILSDFQTLTKTYYGAEIEALNYKRDSECARKTINRWVEKETKKKIKDLIPKGALNNDTRLVLANAVYFKGEWKNQFKKRSTRKSDFYITIEKAVRAQMMRQENDFKLAQATDFQALELPYEGDELSMLILLPNAVDGLPALEKNLSTELLSNLQFIKQEVDVVLPRFKMGAQFNAAKKLAELGMPTAFSELADFSGINGSKDLYIGSVLHQAFIEVNEEGTKAAAATATGMLWYSASAIFSADHPFLFYIRENSTGTILFIGRIVDPSK